MNLFIDSKAKEKLEIIKQRIGEKSIHKVIIKALALYEVITIHYATGGKVVLTHPTMEDVELKL